MQVKIKISHATRQRAFAAGHNVPAEITLDLDATTLPENLRADLAPALDSVYLRVRRDDGVTLEWESTVYPAEGIETLLRAYLAARAAGDAAHVVWRASKAAEKQRKAEDVKARCREILAAGKVEWVPQDDFGDPEARALLAEVRQLKAQLDAAAEAVRRELDAARAAEKRAAAEAQEADKATWIAAHGSDHLRAAVAAGYDCQRLYVTERAALEFPGFAIDFAGRARWERRSCPSEEGLAISLATKGSRVVWLATPTQEVDEEDEWEPREAVVVEDFLGRYDLVREVS